MVLAGIHTIHLGQCYLWKQWAGTTYIDLWVFDDDKWAHYVNQNPKKGLLIGIWLSLDQTDTGSIQILHTTVTAEWLEILANLIFDFEWLWALPFNVNWAQIGWCAGLPVYDFLSVVNENIYHNTGPFWYINVGNMSDFKTDTSR